MKYASNSFSFCKQVMNMNVCVDRKIGGILVTDHPLDDRRYMECDGSRIFKKDYPEFFAFLRIRGNEMTLPDFRSDKPGKLHFYMLMK